MEGRAIFVLVIVMVVSGFCACEAEAGVGVTVAGDLEVVPLDDFEPIGELGGPFIPSSKDYELTNVGPNSIYWGIAKTADWLDFDSVEGGLYPTLEGFESNLVEPLSTWGQLEPNESVTVRASLNATAETLGVGVHTDTLTFTDITHEAEETRGVTLTVTVPEGIWVSPIYFDVNMPEGRSLTETLTIGNGGLEDLHFTLRSRETSREILCGQSTKGISVGAAGMAGEDKIVLEYSFSKPVVSRVAGYDMVRMAGLNLYERIGAPIVPVRPVTVLVPFGKKVVDSRVTVLDERELPGRYRLALAQEVYPLGHKNIVGRAGRNPAIYDKKVPWPGVRHKRVTAGCKRGYQLFTLKLFPLQYVPSTGEISYATRVRLEIYLAESERMSPPRPSLRARSALSRMVDNAGLLRAYPATSRAMERLGVTLLPGGGPYQYVIITSEDLESVPGPWNFQALRDAKIAGGMSATIVTTEWIYANYDGTRPDGGSDNQTRIRNFLIDAYQTWGTEYVLLGGTNSIVPARKFWVDSKVGDITTMPVDMYYGCVDPEECTFDYDADGDYGEPADGVGGGDVDLYAEIYVGRAAVENAVELGNFIGKTLTYASTYGEYLPRISMLGEHLGFGGVSEYAKDSMEQIRLGGDYDGYFTYGFDNHIQPDYFDFNTAGCLPDNPSRCWPLYEKDYDWPKSELIDLMNGGIHVFNHLGHANYTSCMKLSTADLASLTNTDYFFAYSQGCNSGGFDTSNCFAEVMTTTEHGAFAAIMNARSGWGRGNSTDGPSQRFARHFWDAVLGEDMLEAGRANQDSKEDNLWDINGACIRWCYYGLNLFGDPQQQFRFKESCDWLSFEPEGGTIGPGDWNEVDVTFNAMEMEPGTYEAEILVLSDDPCNPMVVVPVTMTVSADDLVVMPAGGFEPNGVRGGPFEPACTTYTLTNNGAGSVSWTTHLTEDWVAADPCEGVLEPNESVDVNVCVTAAADLLDPNVYTETLTFENINSGSIKQRLVTLTVEPPDCFTESFDASTDLEGLMLTFTPDGSSAYYEACREEVNGFPTDPNDGTYVSLGDDDFAEVILSDGAEVLFYGTSYDRFYIGSNGYITFGDGDTEYSGALEDHFNMPRISGLFTDLTPADNQSISYKQLDDRVVVTFEDVPLYGDKDAKSSFQVEMFFVDGSICVSWLDIAATAFVAGLSEGYGLPPDFTVSDLSEYVPCWPFCDFDRDYSVGWVDLGMFVSHWLEEDCNIPLWCGRADLDFSSAVDMFDWSVFAENWLTEMEKWWLPPVSHWKFDEGEGDIAYDSVGDNHGTLVGDTSWVAGKIGSHALDFDGDDDYVDVGTMGDFGSNMDNITVSAWVKSDVTDSFLGLLGTANDGGCTALIVRLNMDSSGDTATGNVEAYIRDENYSDVAGAVDSDTGITNGNWHHLAVVIKKSSGILEMYVDSINQTVTCTRDGEGTVFADFQYPMVLGAWNYHGPITDCFSGSLDDIAIYDRALSAGEIWELYREGAGRQASNPYPADGAVDVDADVVLSWSPGEDVVSHDVYFGTDYNDVNEADISDPNVYMGNQTANSYDPNGLEYETTYYWRIDEVDDSNDRCEGDVWGFTTVGEPNSYLVGWWEFEEGSGTDANDSSGNGNHGTLNGDPNWVAGKIGNYALDFDGDDDYVLVPEDPSLDFTRSSFTFATWVNPHEKRQHIFAHLDSQTTRKGILLRIYENGMFRFGFYYDDLDTASGAIPFDSWSHIVCTYDYNSDTAKIYIDGDLNVTGNNGPYEGARVDSWIGKGWEGQYWNYGIIDDTRIYDRALSAGEIEQLYESGLGY